jgi:retron-type reverse transcriptase
MRKRIDKIRDFILQKILILLIEPYYDNFLHPEIFGFRSGRLPIHAVAEVVGLLRSRQNEKILILLSIKKSDSNVLLQKLKQIVIPIKFERLINN